MGDATREEMKLRSTAAALDSVIRIMEHVERDLNRTETLGYHAKAQSILDSATNVKLGLEADAEKFASEARKEEEELRRLSKDRLDKATDIGQSKNKGESHDAS